MKNEVYSTKLDEYTGIQEKQFNNLIKHQHAAILQNILYNIDKRLLLLKYEKLT